MRFYGQLGAGGIKALSPIGITESPDNKINVKNPLQDLTPRLGAVTPQVVRPDQARSHQWSLDHVRLP